MEILKYLRNLYQESRQPNLGRELEFKQYVEKEVEPQIRAYISESLSRMTYPRQVDIKLRLDRDWELVRLQSITVGADSRKSESHLAYKSGHGEWKLSIGGQEIDYDLKAEWNVAEGLMAVSLTEPKLERLLKGNTVINCLGEIPHILPGPARRKVDDSILDDAEQIVETIQVKYMDGTEFHVPTGIAIETPLETIMKPEEEYPEAFESLEDYKEQYKKLEDEMKVAIQSLGWKWSEVDKKKMDLCIKYTLETWGNLEKCLKMYLRKGGK